MYVKPFGQKDFDQPESNAQSCLRVQPGGMKTKANSTKSIETSNLRKFLVSEDKSDWLTRYRLRQYLGQGGMGVAYLAEDKSNNNAPCVLKQLSIKDASAEEHEEAERFFRREVEMLRHLKHPGIVRLFDHHVTTGQDYFLVMDYIAGNNLDEIIKSWGAFSSEATVEIAIQCCEILEYMHDHDPPIIYRDLKPGNLMLTPEGQIVFIDFGIARTFQPKQIATRVVTTGYSPPEQYSGQPEPRSDLYALGATLSQLLTGVRPKPLMVCHPAKLNENILFSLDDLIGRLTASSPADRPGSATAVRYELYHIYHEIHPDFVVPKEAEIASALLDRYRMQPDSIESNKHQAESSLWQGIKKLLSLLKP